MSKNKPQKKVIEKKIDNIADQICKKCKPLFQKSENEKQNEHKFLLAETENLRKQKEKEMASFRKFRHQDLSLAFFSVVDSLKMALSFKNPNPETKKFLIGVQMAYDNIYKIFANFDIEEIKVKIGDNYNPEFHQTIGSDWNNEYAENKIIKIKQTGFILHDRVIRPAHVIINQKPNKQESKK